MTFETTQADHCLVYNPAKPFEARPLITMVSLAGYRFKEAGPSDRLEARVALPSYDWSPH